MLKKVFTLTDLDGNRYTEEWFFSLSKADLAEMSVGGNQFTEELRGLTANSEGPKALEAFKKILDMTVGKRVGNKLERGVDVSLEFMNSDAYGEFIMELLTDPNAAIDFVRNVVPADLSEKLKFNEQIDKAFGTSNVVELPASDVVAVKEKTWDDYTEAELLEMDQDTFNKIVGTTDPRKMTQMQRVIGMKRYTKQ